MPRSTSTLFPYTTLFRSLGLGKLVKSKTESAGQIRKPAWRSLRARVVGKTKARKRSSKVAAQFPEGIFLRLSVFQRDRKSTRLNSSHLGISYAVFCLKKK